MDGLIGRMTPLFICVLLAMAALGPAAAQEERAEKLDPRSEAELIAVIESDAGYVEKWQACEALRIVGTAESVPALAKLLHDEKLAQAARYALEPMENEAAGEALRNALPDAPGDAKAGIATSLGVRRDAQAVDVLSPLLTSDNNAVATAAAAALGRIGTPEAADALTAAMDGASEGQRSGMAEGLLAAAERLAEDGHVNEAVAIYDTLQGESWPMHVRLGAFRGRVFVRQGEGPKRIDAALKSDNAALRDMAAFLVSELPGNANTTRRLASTVNDLPPAGQVALLRGLGDRGDPAARKAVVEASKSENPDVRRAAAQALGQLGGPEDVPTLVALMASDDDAIARAAETGLIDMSGDGANQAIVENMGEAKPAVQATLLRVLISRNAPQTAETAVAYLDSDNADVRNVALDVLIPTGDVDALPAVVEALKRAGNDEERSTVSRTLDAMAGRIGGESLPAILAAVPDAAPETRVALLSAVSRVGGQDALNAILEGLNDPEASVVDAAARQLTNWPTMEAAPHLLERAKSDDATVKTQAWQGYVRLAREKAEGGDKLKMLENASGLAGRKEDQWLVISAWGTVNSPRALEALLPHLDNEETRNEAGVAITSVAAELAKNEQHQQKAVDALKAVTEKASNDAIKKRAQSVLDQVQPKPAKDAPKEEEKKEEEKKPAE